MVDVLTTNKTSFFREQAHFDYLVEEVFPAWRDSGEPRRIWSAGCSSGEEPYTLGMLLCEHVPNVDTRILATDLSTKVLARAKAARYAASTIESVPWQLRTRYLKACGTSAQREYEVIPAVTSRVSFARLNLMGDWGMRGQFDLILCRNVMIYFTDEIRALLGRRFAERLAPDGVLMIGHAESIASLEQPLRLVRPAIYVH
jgi:chemotaxis protein methyltransferase CheR